LFAACAAGQRVHSPDLSRIRSRVSALDAIDSVNRDCAFTTDARKTGDAVFGGALAVAAASQVTRQARVPPPLV